MSIDNVDSLVLALEWQPEDMVRARRMRKRNMFLLLLFCLAMAALTITEEVINILEAKRTGDWYNPLGIYFISQTAITLIFIACLYALARYAPDIRQPQIEAALLTLRAAAVRGDEGIAPHATKVMDGLAQEQVPGLPVQLRRLQRPGKHLAYPEEMLAYMVLYFGIIMLLGSVVILIFFLSRTGDLWIIVGVSGAIVTAAGTILVVWMVRRNRGFTVTADEIGLHWTLPGWRHRSRSLQWEHAQAFYLVGHLNNNAQ